VKPDALAAGRLQSLLSTFFDQNPDVSATVRRRLSVAVREIANNIAAHAKPDHLFCAVDRSTSTTNVILIDDGDGVSGDLHAPMPGLAAETGRGLPLARAMVTSVTYRRAAHQSLYHRGFWRSMGLAERTTSPLPSAPDWPMRGVPSLNVWLLGCEELGTTQKGI
jgi:hypothetical protein